METLPYQRPTNLDFKPMSQAAPTAFTHLFDEQEAATLQVRADLMDRLIGHIEEKELTQKQAAKQLGTSPRRISFLLNGKISKFTADALANMCSEVAICSEVAGS